MDFLQVSFQCRVFHQCPMGSTYWKMAWDTHFDKCDFIFKAFQPFMSSISDFDNFTIFCGLLVLIKCFRFQLNLLVFKILASVALSFTWDCGARWVHLLYGKIFASFWFNSNYKDNIIVSFCSRNVYNYPESLYLKFMNNVLQMGQSTAQKWSFPLRISSVIVTRSAVSCEFGQIYWRNP